jgi:Protein of unknown function (DUF4019)
VTAPDAKPTLNLERPASLRQRVWWKWAQAITAAVSLLIIWQCGFGLLQGRRQANATVQHFHQQLNTGQYVEIFREADAGFREGKTEADLVKFLQAVHTKLGDTGAANFINIRVNATTNGTFTTAQYKTTFDHGSAVETFTWIKTSNTLRLYGYDIRSNVSVVN